MCRHKRILCLMLMMAGLLALIGCSAADLPVRKIQSTLPDNTQAAVKIDRIDGEMDLNPIGENPTPELRPPTAAPIPTTDPAENTSALPTPMPLPGASITACPVSRPNLTDSPDEQFITTANGFGNPEGTMFIGLWPGGKVFFCPGCAGSLSENGSLGMKFWFYRTIPGGVVFEGRRLDVPGPVARLATLRGSLDGYGVKYFHPAGLVFPQQGCWEVTARIGKAQMTFVTVVLWVPFDPQLPGWLPTGFSFVDTDLSGYPDTIGMIYQSADEGQVIFETSWITFPIPEDFAVLESVTVDGAPGTCYSMENKRTTAAALMWAKNELSYRIRIKGEELSCRELLQIAQFH